MGSDRKRIGLAVLAAALGYFVDAYDLILYNIVRMQSLRGIAVPESELLSAGVGLLEQFGTNLRATVATTAPNFVRGAIVPVTLAFRALGPSLGMRTAAASLGALSLIVAVLALRQLDETYGKDLDFVE
jgi:hypothetical protein